MKNISKTNFTILNTLLFVVILLYSYFKKNIDTANIFSFNLSFWTSVIVFFYGLIFYIIDNRKTGEDKNLRNDNKFLVLNTLSVSVFLIIILENLKLDFFLLSSSILIFASGNTAYWMVTHLGVLGPVPENYSNELVQKMQRNLGICQMALGIIMLTVVLILKIEEISHGYAYIYMLYLIPKLLSNAFTFMTTPEDERYREVE